MLPGKAKAQQISPWASSIYILASNLTYVSTAPAWLAQYKVLPPKAITPYISSIKLISMAWLTSYTNSLKFFYSKAFHNANEYEMKT